MLTSQRYLVLVQFILPGELSPGPGLTLLHHSRNWAELAATSIRAALTTSHNVDVVWNSCWLCLVSILWNTDRMIRNENIVKAHACN